jgi:hypothetical protein
MESLPLDSIASRFPPPRQHGADGHPFHTIVDIVDSR